MIRRVTTVVIWVVAALVVGGGVGMVIATRLRTGQWRVPDSASLVDVKRQVLGDERGPSRTIFLERGPRELTAGTDDAPRGVSSVVAHQGTAARRVPGWKGSDKAWRQTVACVRALFAPFDVVVTDERPATDDHILVVVGGRAGDLGVKDRGVAGLAPFSGDPIPRAVVFAFAAAQGHRPQAVCETIGMEVAHAYGLDHAYLCSDVMTYLRPCGKRTFVDKEVRCGEKKPRDCAWGGATQNSFRRMLAAVGPRK